MPLEWEPKRNFTSAADRKRLVRLIEKASQLANELDIKLQNGAKAGALLRALLYDLREPRQWQK